MGYDTEFYIVHNRNVKDVRTLHDQNHNYNLYIFPTKKDVLRYIGGGGNASKIFKYNYYHGMKEMKADIQFGELKLIEMEGN